MEKKKSFWLSLPGVLTGIASLLTAIIALLTFLSNNEEANPPEKSPLPQQVYSIKVIPESYSIYVGSTVSLTAELRDKENNIIHNLEVKWRSKNPDIVNVTQNGVAKGMKFGIGEITAEYKSLIGKMKLSVGDSETGLYPIEGISK